MVLLVLGGGWCGFIGVRGEGGFVGVVLLVLGGRLVRFCWCNRGGGGGWCKGGRGGWCKGGEGGLVLSGCCCCCRRRRCTTWLSK